MITDKSYLPEENDSTAGERFDAPSLNTIPALNLTPAPETTQVDDKEEKAKPEPTNLLSITTSDERPREKALVHGLSTLTDAELLAVILGSGTAGEDVVTMCRNLLADNDNKLYKLARKDVRYLQKNYKGIGQVKALQILATVELSRRYQHEKFDEGTRIMTSLDAFEYMRSRMEHLSHEEMWVMLLDGRKAVKSVECISKGGTTATIGDVKMILRPALLNLAQAIVLFHNHPSDSLSPSSLDNRLTEHVRDACRAMDIILLDHIIVCRGSRYYSYSDNGKL